MVIHSEYYLRKINEYFDKKEKLLEILNNFIDAYTKTEKYVIRIYDKTNIRVVIEIVLDILRATNVLYDKKMYDIEMLNYYRRNR